MNFEPRILLKYINYKQFLADYKNGVFFRPIPEKQKVVKVEDQQFLGPSYNKDQEEGVYIINDRNGQEKIIATTGFEGVKMINKQGVELKGGRCQFCLYDYQTLNIGYPLHFEEREFYNEKLEPARFQIFYIFWIEGRFCSFECCYAYLKRLLIRGEEQENIHLNESEQYLKLLFYLTYPGKVLREANNPLLLKSNGGSLNREEWLISRYRYRRTERVILLPIKVEYLRESLNNNDKTQYLS